jgi:uncharacterized protein YkwD
MGRRFLVAFVLVLLALGATAAQSAFARSSATAPSARAMSAAPVAHAAKRRHHRRHRRHRGQRQQVAASPATATPAGLPAPNPPAPTAQSCSDTTLQPAPTNLDRIRAATLCLVNQERARNGLGALQEQPQLEAASNAHVADMAARNYFDHVSPSGSTPVSRMTAAGYLGGNGAYMVGENIAYGTVDASPARIVAAWMASPDHRDNILTREFRDSGIGVIAAAPAFAGSGTPAATYGQDFGVRG